MTLPHSATNGQANLTHYLSMLLRETRGSVDADNLAEFDEILLPAFKDIFGAIEKLEARVSAIEKAAQTASAEPRITDPSHENWLKSWDANTSHYNVASSPASAPKVNPQSAAIANRPSPVRAKGPAEIVVDKLVEKLDKHGEAPSEPPTSATAKQVKLKVNERVILARLRDGWELRPRRRSPNYILIDPATSNGHDIKPHIIDSLKERGYISRYDTITGVGRAALAAQNGSAK